VSDNVVVREDTDLETQKLIRGKEKGQVAGEISQKGERKSEAIGGRKGRRG